MNEWIVAGAVLTAAVLPLQWVAFRRGPGEALVALNQCGLVVVVTLLVLAVGFGRSPFLELAEVGAFVSFVGVFMFARFFEHWV